MQAFLFLFKTLTNLYMVLYVLRFVLQFVRADFYNPFSQFVLRATGPLLIPVRRIIPGTAKVDIACIVVLLLLEAAVTWFIVTLVGAAAGPVVFVSWVLLRLVNLVLWFYIVAIFVSVIMSWMGQAGYNPVANVIADIVNPLLNPVRRVLPDMGGLDLSPMFALILIFALQMLLPRLPLFLL
jgi:YggT family protein